MDSTYTASVERGDSLDMSTFKTGKSVRGVVKNAAGKTVWVSSSVWDKGRAASGKRLEAVRMMKRYADYLAEHGRAWEDVQAERRAEEKRQRRIAYLEEHIPKLQAELDQLRK